MDVRTCNGHDKKGAKSYKCLSTFLNPSQDFILCCQENGITQSMNHAGCLYDNAPMESHYNTLKAEELDYVVLEFAYNWYK